MCNANLFIYAGLKRVLLAFQRWSYEYLQNTHYYVGSKI